ncbi:Integral membrane protein [Pyrenophora teres f. maculata]|nr:Integral membrane protein [Pyrenophora teres f. maculata]
MENITSASSDMEAVGGGIPRATAAFTAMTWYNSIELLFLVFFTFKKYSGLYFWSLIVDVLRAYMKQNNVAHDTHVDNILMTVGLVLMVPGQSLVLYSRLHLISSNQKLVRSILWMIIVLAVVLCVPTSMLNLREYTDQPGTYTRTYSAMAKTQMTLSSFEEVFISCVYIWETRNAMRVNFNALDRKWMWQLIAMNIFLLVMDTALLVMEFLELYMILNTFKSLVHSFKLKIEFAVLTQMVRVSQTRRQSGSSAMKSLENLENTSKWNEFVLKQVEDGEEEQEQGEGDEEEKKKEKDDDSKKKGKKEKKEREEDDEG